MHEPEEAQKNTVAYFKRFTAYDLSQENCTNKKRLFDSYDIDRYYMVIEKSKVFELLNSRLVRLEVDYKANHALQVSFSTSTCMVYTDKWVNIKTLKPIHVGNINTVRTNAKLFLVGNNEYALPRSTITRAIKQFANAPTACLSTKSVQNNIKFEYGDGNKITRVKFEGDIIFLNAFENIGTEYFFFIEEYGTKQYFKFSNPHDAIKVFKEIYNYDLNTIIMIDICRALKDSFSEALYCENINNFVTNKKTIYYNLHNEKMANIKHVVNSLAGEKITIRNELIEKINCY